MNRTDALASSLSRPAPDPFVDEPLDLDALWQAYFVSRDDGLRNQLLVHFLPLSRMIARHIHGRVPSAVEFDDLAQAAVFGLRSAIKAYDPARGVPFENYCGPRVRGAILDHLRSLDWAPRMLRSRVQRVREMISQIEMETGSAPTHEQVAGALNMPMDELQSLLSDMDMPKRLTASSNAADPDNAINLDMLADRGAMDPTHEAQRNDLRDFLVRGLSPVERQVILLYYYDSLSFREIGETLNLCESRVSQIHHAVIRRLRERMHRIGGQSLD